MAEQVLPQGFKLPYQFNCLSQSQTNETLADLKALLASWGMLELFQWFTAHQLFINVLAIMDASQAKYLLVRNGFNEGIQALFFHHWLMWKATLIAAPNSNDDAQMVSAPQITTNTVVEEPRKSNFDMRITKFESSKLDVNLDMIFEWGGKLTETLMLTYNKANKLSETDRAKLCDMIITYCLVNGVKMNVGLCRNLAADIVSTFPTEVESAYHRPKNGRLITKYNYNVRGTKDKNNEKRPVSPSTSVSPTCSKKSRNEDVKEEDIQLCISKLNNDLTLTLEETKHIWRRTSAYRISFIQDISTSTQNICDMWKHYSDPLGHIYIDIDFTEMFGQTSDFFLKIDQFIECFMKYIKNNEHRGFKNDFCKDMWKKYDAKLSESAKVTIIFHVLHEILKPSLMKVLRGKSKTKRTIEDSIAEFFQQFPSIEAWNKCENSEHRSLNPKIAIIGDVLNPTHIYVYFDGTKYIASNMLVAIDTCFKVFHVLNIEYPVDCINVWTFIELWFYKHVASKNSKKILPNVNVDTFIAKLTNLISPKGQG